MVASPFCGAVVVLASCTARAASWESGNGLPRFRSVQNRRPYNVLRYLLTTLQRLRYKDFHLASRPAPIESDAAQPEKQAGLFEVESVSEFADAMEKRSISTWWKRAMEFE